LNPKRLTQIALIAQIDAENNFRLCH